MVLPPLLQLDPLGCLSSLCPAWLSWLKRSMSWRRSLSHPTFKWRSRQHPGSARIQPGQSVQIILYQSRIELIPLRAVRDMRGFLKGINISVEREPDRT